MKLWIDAQLSPAIAAWINRTFTEIKAESVHAVGLRDATDSEILDYLWQYIKCQNERNFIYNTFKSNRTSSQR